MTNALPDASKALNAPAQSMGLARDGSFVLLHLGYHIVHRSPQRAHRCRTDEPWIV